MVTPVVFIALALAAAFSLGVLGRFGKKFSLLITIAVPGVMTFISFQWVHAFFTQGAAAAAVFTAGFRPPFSIMLLMDENAAVMTLLINAVSLLSVFYLRDIFLRRGYHAMAVFLIAVMGMNGMVLTADMFNLFVFLEIESIAIAGLMLLGKDTKSFSAGFKYMIATGVISVFLLLGIITVYSITGSLVMSDIVGAISAPAGVTALFLILTALLIETKPFPANGWGLDIYSAAHPGVAAFIASASSAAGLFVLYRVFKAAGPETWSLYVTIGGLLTFVASHLFALKQTGVRRLLGYSSIGQTGLLVAVIGLSPVLGEMSRLIFFGLFITNFLAKAGLFWIRGIFGIDEIRRWGALKTRPVLLFLMGSCVFALAALPVFPSFFAKWQLISGLLGTGLPIISGVILFGSLMEAVYLFRWFGIAVKGETTPKTATSKAQYIPVIIVVASLYMTGADFMSRMSDDLSLSFFIVPLLFSGVLLLADRLPVWIKNTAVIAGTGWYAWVLLPELEAFKFIFGVIFLLGGIVTMIAGYARSGQRRGFYPFVVLMYTGLAGLLTAESTFQFFFAWELMTAGSYVLILRGKRSMPHALQYMIFSLGGAFLMLAGFGLLAAANYGDMSLATLASPGSNAGVIYLLLAAGFFTKTAVMGLHIWLPGAHAEAETDVSPMVSAILLKGGMYGFVLLMLTMGDVSFRGVNLPYIIGWLGAVTAFLGNIAAAYQEDAKRLLAYSSVAQLGYAVFGLAMMTHLGWLTAFAFALNHFIFKALLFLAVGGVVMRLGTKNMYRMGGLIKRMPFSFISVLIGIIALSGVPPLTGFAGKWLSYNAIIEKGWYLQGLLVIISGLIAFLYCFRLIYSIFLGQLKDEHRQVREAPFWMLFPQYILIIAIMVFSTVPSLVLKPLGTYLTAYFPDGALVWNGTTAVSRLGYWDGPWMMYVTGAVFAVVFIWLLIINRRAQKVGQFNIVYAAERPERPETTHFGYNFFAHYRRALGFFSMPLATEFWKHVAEWFHGAVDFGRRLYSGNGQTYVLHILLYVVLFYGLLFGGEL